MPPQGEHKLKSSETFKDKFERGHTDVFAVPCLDLGQLSKLRIWHDSAGFKGSSWLLESVTVVEEQSGSKFEFACGKWLSKSKEDKQTIRELVCGTADLKGRSTTYKVVVKTADKSGAPTDSDVVLKLVGDQGKSDELLLAKDGKHFERGQEDEFLFPGIRFLGEISGATVWLSRKGKRTEADKWIPQAFSVIEVRSGQEFTMKIDGPISEKKEKLTVAHVEAGAAQATASLQAVMYEVRTLPLCAEPACKPTFKQLLFCLQSLAARFLAFAPTLLAATDNNYIGHISTGSTYLVPKAGVRHPVGTDKAPGAGFCSDLRF